MSEAVFMAFADMVRQPIICRDIKHHFTIHETYFYFRHDKIPLKLKNLLK